MEVFSNIANSLNGYLWPPLVFLCLGAGLYFTVVTGAIQLRKLPEMIRLMFNGHSSDRGVSSFQALSMALAGRVGTGNIAGVATAIAFGGPGAVFWMWAVALLGASSAFIESTLGQIYKTQDPDTGEYRGGPAFYLNRAYAHTKFRALFKVFGIIFAVVAIIAMGFLLPGVQANGIATAVESAWGFHAWIPAVGIVIMLSFIIVGGVKRIAGFASLVVPFMAAAYILAAIVIVILNFNTIPDVLRLIVSSAFGADATFGGILGSAVMWGVRRGIYSNEAGQGTGPHSAAAAEVSHPVKQGLVQAGSVYIDTLLVCSATAFMILSTGMYRVFENEDDSGKVLAEGGSLAENVTVGPAFAQHAFDTLIPGAGASFIAVALTFFAFTTIIAYYYMAETNLTFLMQNVKNALIRNGARRFLQLLALLAAVVGCVNTAGGAWVLGDVGVALMAWVNIVGILIIQKPALKALKDYNAQRKAGKDPVFDPQTVGIEGADLWVKHTGTNIDATSTQPGSES